MPQQIGVLPKQTVQQQPDLQHVSRHSQHFCNMSQQALSPEVQVMHTPSLVYSHLHEPQHRLHWQTDMPFQVQQQLHIPSATILQRFCNVAQLKLSSHLQYSLKPPAHFSNLNSQRGTTQ